MDLMALVALVRSEKILISGYLTSVLEIGFGIAHRVSIVVVVLAL